MTLLRLPKKEELVFPKEVISYIVFSFIFFILFFFSGLSVALNEPSVVNDQISNLLKMVEGVSDLNPVGLSFFIFFNNCLVAFLASLGGILFSIFPLIIIMTNGFLVGIVFYYILNAVSWQFFFVGILPHGLIELPIIFFSTAMGIWLGKCFFSYLFLKTETKTSLLTRIKRVFYTYIFIIVPFLLLSALIESFFTPYLLKIFFDIDLVL